jgi:hypothetical protein
MDVLGRTPALMYSIALCNYKLGSHGDALKSLAQIIEMVSFVLWNWSLLILGHQGIKAGLSWPLKFCCLSLQATALHMHVPQRYAQHDGHAQACMAIDAQTRPET